MSNIKASLYVLLLSALVSCSKELSPNPGQDETPGNAQDLTDPMHSQSKKLLTVFGIMVAQQERPEIEKQMDKSGINLVRTQVILSKSTYSLVINQYINDGYNVQVNLNWLPTSSGPVAYPKNLTLLKKQAEAFFKYYQPYKDKMPLIVVENEWDNLLYHTGTVQDYLTELAVITSIGHKYGFKIADAGLSSTNLHKWMYSQLSGDAQIQWKQNYGGVSPGEYAMLVTALTAYSKGIKYIPIDYLNMHWYNISKCYNGFEQASQTYMKACGKTTAICNEFGIKTNSVTLFNQTVNEIKGNVYYALAYSGVDNNAAGKAVFLTGEMLKAFK